VDALAGGEGEGGDDEYDAHPFDETADIDALINGDGDGDGAGPGGTRARPAAVVRRKSSLRAAAPPALPAENRRAMGVLIRIWYLEEGQDVNTGEIVGYTFMDAATLAEPPLGRRSFPIEPHFPITLGSMYDRDLASGLRERKRKMLVREEKEKKKGKEEVEEEDVDGAAAAAAVDNGVYESSKQLLTAKLQVPPPGLLLTLRPLIAA
jgi:hypothetical protein